MSPLTDGNSYWIESTPATELPALEGPVEADVCVVGAGITGLLCAWELLLAGRSVVVLEAKRIATSVTGYTTAKLTSQHGFRYGRLEREHGALAARNYGEANERALRRISQIAGELGVDVQLESLPAYVYATEARSVDALQREVQAAVRAGLPASFTRDAGLPFATVGAVRFDHQAQLHPRMLLLPLATALISAGVRIFEQSKAAAVNDGEPCVVEVDGGEVRARHVIVATLLPAAGVGAELRKHVYCHQGYAVATPLASEVELPGAYISYEKPMRSLRTIPTDAGRLLQVGGGAHVTDPNTGATPWDDLEQFGREQFGVGEPQYRWTTQDYSCADGVPLIGALDDAARINVATGFGGWGLTTAGVAAQLLTERIVGGAAQAWHGLFDPRRSLPVADARVVSGHSSSGTDRGAAEVVSSLSPGSAAVVRQDDELLGAYRTPEGELNVVSAVCTHLGGVLLWDRDEQGWQCPCHGSTFAPDGAVRSGPAKLPLPDRSASLSLG